MAVGVPGTSVCGLSSSSPALERCNMPEMGTDMACRLWFPKRAMRVNDIRGPWMPQACPRDACHDESKARLGALASTISNLNLDGASTDLHEASHHHGSRGRSTIAIFMMTSSRRAVCFRVGHQSTMEHLQYLPKQTSSLLPALPAHFAGHL